MAKKILSVFLSLIMVLSTAVFFASAQEGIALFKDGTPQVKIIIHEGADSRQTYAADTLKNYLSKIGGSQVQIINDSAAAEGTEILIGSTNRFAPDLKDLPDNSYIIKFDSSNIIIAGNGTRGTIAGVYAFLVKFCGCHWYNKDTVIIPEDADLMVTAKDVTYSPYFEYTDVDTMSPRDPIYSLANGLTGGAYRNLTDDQGGSVAYISGFCHTLATQFCAPGKYFEEHPEYFALHDGKRVDRQLCLTNETTLSIVTQEVLDLLKIAHNPDADLQIVSLTQNDNRDYCECEKCKALDDKNGSHSGTMITFVNSVAKKVKEAGYDNVAIDTFAYQYTRSAPTNVVPDDNVIVRLCSIECCFGHTLNDPACKENVSFMKDLQDWGKICSRIYIWDYVNNYAQTCCIFPDFGVLQSNIRTFYDNNVKGIYEEGNYYIANCDAEFGEMRSYLLSRTMQDPYCDYYAEMDSYMKAVYGPGWENIREFIDITTDHAVTKNGHLFIYQSSQSTLYNMTPSVIRHCDELWTKAMEAAETQQQKDEIERSQLCWRYWKSNNHASEFSLLRPVRRMIAGKELYNDLVKYGVKTLSEGGSGLSSLSVFHYFYAARHWAVSNENDFRKTISPYLDKVYDFIIKLVRR